MPVALERTHGSPAANAGLHVRGLAKSYPAMRALRGVDLDVCGGRIHGLVGGNGSGKSTFVKVLSGVEVADAGGAVSINGQELAAELITPTWAHAAGVRVVHQDLGLFGNLSVAENLFAGRRPPCVRGAISWRAMRRAAQGMLDRTGISVRASDRLDSLRSSDQTLVAVARAIEDHSAAPHRLLVLDEPTARLHPAEAERLLEALRRLAGEDVTILYISHHLDEVLSLCSEVTVLRDGVAVQTRTVDGLEEATLAELFVGRAFRHAARSSREPGDTVLRIDGLDAGRLRDIKLEVRAGEVVGISGLVGSGRSHLLQAIFGARRRAGGRITVRGRPLEPGDVAASVRAGVALIPEDRVGEGVFLNLGIPENVSASQTHRYSRHWFLNHRRERRDAAAVVDRFGIRAHAVDALLHSLSGGNQQKVLVARWLAMDPVVLLLDEPTQGVDVAARADIHAQIDDAAQRGCAVLLITSDLDEMERLTDRVLVLSGGRLSPSVEHANDLDGAHT